MTIAISPAEAHELRKPVTKPFTPSNTDLKDMIARAMAACDASAQREKAANQFEAACAHNRRIMQRHHDAYLNQMPRARGYRT